jgi:hypothetical protein
MMVEVVSDDRASIDDVVSVTGMVRIVNVVGSRTIDPGNGIVNTIICVNDVNPYYRTVDYAYE